MTPTICLLSASFLMVFINCQAIYLRAHKREPLLAIGVGCGLINGVLIWWFGSRFGTEAAAGTFLGTTLLLNVPLVWTTWAIKRKEWHRIDAS